MSKVCKNPQAEAWGYTDEARLRGLKVKVCKNPQAEARRHTDEARLRGLKTKIDFYQPDWV